MPAEGRLMALKKHGKARRKRLEGAGCKADDDDLEEAVFEWIIDMHSRNLHVFEDDTGKGKSFFHERQFLGKSGLALPIFEPQEALSSKENYDVFCSS